MNDGCPGCGGPTEYDREVPPNPYCCDKCIMATGSMGPPVKRNFNELRRSKRVKELRRAMDNRGFGDDLTVEFTSNDYNDICSILDGDWDEDKKAHKSKQVCAELSMSDKTHQLATLLDAILYQADLLEQVQAMYGEDSIEAASRLDLLTGVIQGAKATVDRHNLTPNGIYRQGASND